MFQRISLSLLALLVSGCDLPQGSAGGDNSRRLTLGDGLQIEHPWDESGPLPASNDWVNVEVAGYLLSEDRKGDGFSWTWTFTLGLKNPTIELVAVSDVTDSNVLRLVAPEDGVFSEDKWLAQSDSIVVSGFHLPWLFKDGDSVRVLRFSIADKRGETRILYQPVLFTHAGKKSLLAIARSDTDIQ